MFYSTFIPTYGSLDSTGDHLSERDRDRGRSCFPFSVAHLSEATLPVLIAGRNITGFTGG